MRLLTCALLGRIAPGLCGCGMEGKPLRRQPGVVLLLESSKELPARAGWGCVWTSAPVHPSSSELPAGLQEAAPLREMKAVGELLPRAVCAGCLCDAVWFAAVPFGTSGAAQSSVWYQLPSDCSQQRWKQGGAG